MPFSKDAVQRKSLGCKLSVRIGETRVVTKKIDKSGNALVFGWCTLAIIVFGVIIAIRIRLLGTPLERDEGEYAYAGQLMLQGIPPYKLAYSMKFPGTYAAYALIMSIFGQTIFGIHLGLLLTNAGTTVLIFFVGRRLINATAGIAAAMSYAVLSVSPFVLGLAAHATHFVVVLVLGGMLLLLDESGRQQLGRLFASGLIFGLSILMKQPAVFFVVFAAIYLLYNDVQRRFTLKSIFLRSLIFSAGVILPFGIALLLLWRAGVFGKFWFWAIDYAGQYGTLIPIRKAPEIFLPRVKKVIRASWALWTLAGIGAGVGLVDKSIRARTVFLLGLLLFSTFALCLGSYFRSHYFIMILPAVSLLVGVGITKLSDLLTARMILVRFVPLVVLGTTLSLPILWQKKFFFQVSPVDACRMIYPDSPFVESVKIADYLREHTSRDDTIAVFGSEPEIYFYAQRHSATGYIYTYGLMEPQKYARQMQEEMIHEIERARPTYLVSVVVFNSWLWGPASDRLIFTLADEYTAQNYKAAGLVSMTSAKTDYFFGDIPLSVESLENRIFIYRRNP